MNVAVQVTAQGELLAVSFKAGERNCAGSSTPALLMLPAFSARVQYPLRGDNWSDHQDQKAIPAGASCR